MEWLRVELCAVHVGSYYWIASWLEELEEEEKEEEKEEEDFSSRPATSKAHLLVSFQLNFLAKDSPISLSRKADDNCTKGFASTDPTEQLI